MKYLYAIFLILILSLSATAAPVDKTGFFFVQIADTQLGMAKDNDLTPEIEHFQKAVEHINRLKPAFVVIAGDLINKAHDPKQIRAFWRIAKQIRLDVPLYLVAGNHDLSSASEADIKSYNKLFGKDYYSFSYNGSKFIVMNSPLLCSPTADLGMRQAQKIWFEQQLASAKSENSNHIFVFTHQPWFLENPDEEDCYWTVPKALRNDYIAMMEKYNVDFATAGHCHMEKLAHSKNLTMIATRPLSVMFGPEPVGFEIFKVYKDHVDYNYYSIYQMPEKIEL